LRDEQKLAAFLGITLGLSWKTEIFAVKLNYI